MIHVLLREHPEKQDLVVDLITIIIQIIAIRVKYSLRYLQELYSYEMNISGFLLVIMSQMLLVECGLLATFLTEKNAKFKLAERQERYDFFFGI